MVIIHHHPVNRLGRTFIVGDLHGCYNQLMFLLHQIGFDFENDILYCPGDLGDRGPQSELCVRLTQKKWFRPTKGNHDRLLWDSCYDPSFNWPNFVKHGGNWVLDLEYEKRMELAAMVEALPNIIVVGEGEERFNVFHAEFHGNDDKLDGLAGRKYAPVWLDEGRMLFKGEVEAFQHKGLSTSYVGHTIVRDVMCIGSHVYMDTGGFLAEFDDDSGHGLSIYEPATNRIYKTNNIKGRPWASS